MVNLTNNNQLQLYCVYKQSDVELKLQQCQSKGYVNDIVYMIHSYIDIMSNEYMEQNDLIILNVTNTKYIELVIYMF